MLDNTILRKICKKNQLSYIIFSKDFKVIEFDKDVLVLSNEPTSLKISADIRDSFWELMGLEENILNLIDTKEKNFNISIIYKNSRYYDIDIELFSSKKNEESFIAYLSQKTNFSMEYLKTIQKFNKKTLILEIESLSEQKEKNYYDLIKQNILIFHVDIHGIITQVNSICLYFLGIDENKIIGQHFSLFFQSRESDTNQTNTIFNATNIHGDKIFFYADVIPIENQGVIAENIIVCQDITHLKKVEKELEYASHHDSLTGLANRSFLLKKIDKAIQTSENSSYNFNICFIDLNKFKAINDNYGHHAGDMLLKHVASLLENMIRKFDTVARIGGDEFIILLEKIENKEYLDSTIQRIKNLARNNPLIYNEDDIIQFDFSLGISSYPKDGKDAQSLLNFADKEMYKNKARK